MGSEASETAWWPSLCDTSRASVTKRTKVNSHLSITKNTLHYHLHQRKYRYRSTGSRSVRSTSDFTLGAASKSAAAREASVSTDTSLPAGVYRIRISTNQVETTIVKAPPYLHRDVLPLVTSAGAAPQLSRPVRRPAAYPIRVDRGGHSYQSFS